MEEIGIVDNSAYAPKAIPMYVALRFLDECEVAGLSKAAK